MKDLRDAHLTDLLKEVKARIEREDEREKVTFLQFRIMRRIGEIAKQIEEEI